MHTCVPVPVQTLLGPHAVTGRHTLSASAVRGLTSNSLGKSHGARSVVVVIVVVVIDVVVVVVTLDDVIDVDVPVVVVAVLDVVVDDSVVDDTVVVVFV